VFYLGKNLFEGLLVVNKAEKFTQSRIKKSNLAHPNFLKRDFMNNVDESGSMAELANVSIICPRDPGSFLGIQRKYVPILLGI
jgi:hypothetical protein